MVRMAGRLAENFISSDNYHSDHGRYKTGGDSGTYSRGSLGSSTGRRITVYETEDDEQFLDAIALANMDAVNHVNSKDPRIRNFWRIIIILFVALAVWQCAVQISLYLNEPVATNIEAEYPSRIAFPTVAICNNNQYRLTYLTGGRIMSRRVKSINGSLLSVGLTSDTVFDTVLRKSWDMDAVKFLRSAAHWKSRMILGCTWPNGSTCALSDFKAVWTTTGLCWAINTDPQAPFEVTGSGAEHGLRLLLNVESYERVDACTTHFRTRSLPGLKILIYNQTDIPESSQNGVNVPSGYSMDIPFKMQHRNKLSGIHCIEETDAHRQASSDFNHPDNIRTCTLRRYMREVEESCHCSLRRAFTPNSSDIPLAACNVDQYFGCAQAAMRRVREEGTARHCLPTCKSIDYTAWQDMNRLPQNLMPALIEEQESEDEDDVEEEELDENISFPEPSVDSTFSCKDSAFLDETQVMRIKRDAHRAYEMQARHQEDIFLRSRRLIARLRNAIHTIEKQKWGWHSEHFVPVYERLAMNVSCFSNFSEKHGDIVDIIHSRPHTSEEKKTNQMFYLLDERAFKRNNSRYLSIGDLKSRYGDRVDEVADEIALILRVMEKLWSVFMPDSYMKSLTGDFSRMDKIVDLMEKYELNKLQRRAWAEKMQSRQMKHFFEDDFYESYYQPLIKDLDQTLVKQIDEVEGDWERIKYYLQRGSAAKTGAVMFFGDARMENQRAYENLLVEMHECAAGKLRKEAGRILNGFKRNYRELQAAYSKLFKEELPDYLENFEFGNKFVGDNFAMVNIFLHKMNLEVWSQDRTYGFWSLACDIGGALGLFLGASLLTMIELITLCLQYGLCGKRARNLKCPGMDSLKTNIKKAMMGNDFCSCCGREKSEEPVYKKKSQSYQRRFTNEEEENDKLRSRASSEDRYKKSIWSNIEGHPSTSSLTNAELREFLERVQRNSQPHRYDDEVEGIPSEDHIHRDFETLCRNLQVPENRQIDRLTEENLIAPIQETPDIDPISELSTSSAAAAPPLFQTRPARRDKQSYV